jgi:hypothetical protein
VLTGILEEQAVVLDNFLYAQSFFLDEFCFLFRPVVVPFSACSRTDADIGKSEVWNWGNSLLPNCKTLPFTAHYFCTTEKTCGRVVCLLGVTIHSV